MAVAKTRSEQESLFAIWSPLSVAASYFVVISPILVFRILAIVVLGTITTCLLFRVSHGSVLIRSLIYFTIMVSIVIIVLGIGERVRIAISTVGIASFLGILVTIAYGITRRELNLSQVWWVVAGLASISAVSGIAESVAPP